MRNLTARPSEVPAEFVTVREAARRKGVSVTTIRNWARAERVRFVRERRAIPGHRGLFSLILVSWPDVQAIAPANGPGNARRT